MGSVKKKINIVEIRINAHELHSETRHRSIPKMPWKERVYHLCDIEGVEDEKNLLLYRQTYTNIGSKFQNICDTTNLLDLLTQ